MLLSPDKTVLLASSTQPRPLVPRASSAAPAAAASPPTGTVMEGLTALTALMNPSPAVSVAQLSHTQNGPLGFVSLPPPHYQLLGHCVKVSARQSVPECCVRDCYE